MNCTSPFDRPWGAVAWSGDHPTVQASVLAAVSHSEVGPGSRPGRERSVEAVTDDAGHALPGHPAGQQRNLADLVAAAATARPDHPAFLHAGRTLTWAEVDAAVDRAADGLLALGLAPGDRVGLHLGNTLDFPVAYFGVLRAGLVAVPLNPGYTRDELAHALGDSGARGLITTRGTAATAQVVAT